MTVKDSCTQTCTHIKISVMQIGLIAACVYKQRERERDGVRRGTRERRETKTERETEAKRQRNRDRERKEERGREDSHISILVFKPNEAITSPVIV